MNSPLELSQNDISARTLPLITLTPESWADAVLASPIELLIDHALLEKKASQNALNLLHQ